MEITLRTKPNHFRPHGSKIAEAYAVIYYENGKPAQLLCLMENGNRAPIRIEDLEPKSEVERIIKELEKK